MDTNTTPPDIFLNAIVPKSRAGSRLDQIAVDLFPEYSRGRIQAWIKSGELRVNGDIRKQTARLAGGEEIVVQAVAAEEGEWLPEAIPLDVVFEDDSILVVNKPANLVVHPAAGNWSGTLLNGLLAYADCFKTLPRAGIVHRLDKDTTGLMVVAKTLAAQNGLVKQLQDRRVKRLYRALTMGGPDEEGIVNKPIGRHAAVRTKMAVVSRGGKDAITHYQVLAKYLLFRDLSVSLETGRTHQIRVHMAWLGYPLVWDQLYGRKPPATLNIGHTAMHAVISFPRQALHAQELSLRHPESGELMSWRSELPQDYVDLLMTLKEPPD